MEKFTLSREAIKAASALLPIAKSRVKPILNCAKFRCADGRAEIFATNLEVAARIECASEGSASDVAIPLEALVRFAGVYGDDHLSVVVDGTSAVLSSASAKFKIQTMPASEFPFREFSGEAIAEVPSHVMQSAARVAEFTGETRQAVLDGVGLVSLNNALYFAGSEGHFLALHRLRDCNGDERRISFCADACKLFPLLTGSCEILNDNSSVTFKTASASIMALKLEGKYPLIEQVLRIDESASCLVNREAAIRALRPATMATDQLTNMGTVCIGKDFAVSMKSETRESQSSTECVELTGEAMCDFNVAWLMKCFSSFPSNSAVRVKIDMNRCAIGLGIEEYKTVLMGGRD